MDNHATVRKKLIDNWAGYKRDFTWRHNPDPYKIMIAEFMLQRTKAKQVEPVYKQFLEKFPSISKLTMATEPEITKLLISLGLHKRSSNFIMAAKYIIEKYNGKFPYTREDLLDIPGIGSYVAGAILTTCFNKPEYVVDSNIARFINRYYGLSFHGEIRRKREIVDIAKELFNYSDTKSLLFTLLDFTALICKPLSPAHENCHLFKSCKYTNKFC